MKELPGLAVEVTDVVFMPGLEAPAGKPFPFVYFITIRNGSGEPVTIRGRKWVVTDGDGQTMVVEGEGVVGQNPRLEPGETFSYNSYHTVRSDGQAEGALFGETDDGRRVFARIPPFRMRVPPTA